MTMILTVACGGGSIFPLFEALNDNLDDNVITAQFFTPHQIL